MILFIYMMQLLELHILYQVVPPPKSHMTEVANCMNVYSADFKQI